MHLDFEEYARGSPYAIPAANSVSWGPRLLAEKGTLPSSAPPWWIHPSLNRQRKAVRRSPRYLTLYNAVRRAPYRPEMSVLSARVQKIKLGVGLLISMDSTVEPVLTHTFRWTAQAMGYHRLWDMSGVLKINHIKTNIFWAGSHLCSPLHD